MTKQEREIGRLERACRAGRYGVSGFEVVDWRVQDVTLGEIRAAHPWGPEFVHPRSLLGSEFDGYF